MKKTSFARKTLIVLLISTLVVFAVHVLLKYISVVIHNEQHGALFELSARFDVNDENSVPQWFSQMMFLSVGVSALLSAYLSSAKSARFLWIVIGVIGILLSLDDVATLHEFVLQSLHNRYFLDMAPSVFVNAWLLVLPVILLVGGSLVYWASRVLPRRTMLVLAVGGLTYVFGKILMDSVANNVTDLFLDSGIMQGLEKIFQYSGISIILYGILDHLEQSYGQQIKRAVKALK